MQKKIPNVCKIESSENIPLIQKLRTISRNQNEMKPKQKKRHSVCGI